MRREGITVNIAEVGEMTKRIIGLILLFTGIVWAWTDLNPPGNNVCRAGTINSDPSTISGEAQFDLIYDNCPARIGDGEVWRIRTDEADWWHSGSMSVKTYGYMMVKFSKPGGYSSGTLYWQIAVNSGVEVKAYRWDKSSTPHTWTYMNTNPGGWSNPPPYTKSYTIPSSYFDANGNLWLLFKGGGTCGAVKCDVVDIHY